MGNNKIDEKIKKQVGKINIDLSTLKISTDLETNSSELKKLFNKDETFILREVENKSNSNYKFILGYCAGMVDSGFIGDNIIRPLIANEILVAKESLIDTVINKVLFANNPMKVSNYQEVVESITYGDTVLFLPGAQEAVIMGTQGFPIRGVEEPGGETILSGPKEGFSESLISNLTFVHRRLRTNDLKMEMRTFGTRTHTKACICYLDSLVKPKVLKELMRRLDEIEIDGILDANYIDELIRDNPYSPFRATGFSERPDVIVSKILEGRIAIFIDGTPVVLTVPYLFIENFQSNEDYYMNYYYTSVSRIVRILGFISTIFAPCFYLAVTTHHQEMLPTPLLLNISNERLNVPFPMWLELIVMLAAFDVLRETGVRMPAGVGQTMSVVGALILGSAAVTAKIASSLVIIVVALTGVTSLLIPKLYSPAIMVRLFLFAGAAFAGFTGLTLCTAILIIHTLRLKSFTLWQIPLSGNLDPEENKDIIVRAPIWKMKKRPKDMSMDSDRYKEVKRGRSQ